MAAGGTEGAGVPVEDNGARVPSTGAGVSAGPSSLASSSLVVLAEAGSIRRFSYQTTRDWSSEADRRSKSPSPSMSAASTCAVIPQRGTQKAHGTKQRECCSQGVHVLVLTGPARISILWPVAVYYLGTLARSCSAIGAGPPFAFLRTHKYTCPISEVSLHGGGALPLSLL